MDTQVKALPLLSIINGLSQYFEKGYCYPTQEKLRDFLSSRLNIHISLSTLNRWLRVVEDAGYLIRRRRIRRDKKLGMVFQSTLYYMAYRGYMLLARQGVNVWAKVKALAAEARASAAPQSNKPEKVLSPSDPDFYKDEGVKKDIKEYLN